MRRDLASDISSDERLNDELRVDLDSVSHSKNPKRRARGFVRFLVAICIGVAGTLGWQSYGEAIKQMVAIRAPELGWSPEAKQKIATSIQWLGWTTGEKTAAETVASKASTTTSLDPAKVEQMVQNLATVREAVQELAAGQTRMTREIDKLESAVVEILMKMPEPPAAPARKPTPMPTPSSRPTPPQQ